MSKRTATFVGAIVGVALVFALYGFVARGIIRQRRRQAALNDQIIALSTALADDGDGETTLPTRQAELATAEAELDALRSAFPDQVDAIEVLDYLTDTAAEHNVTLERVESRPPTTTSLGGDDYRVHAYELALKGEIADVASFVKALESGSVETLTLDQMQIGRQAETSSGSYDGSCVVKVYVRP